MPVPDLDRVTPIDPQRAQGRNGPKMNHAEREDLYLVRLDCMECFLSVINGMFRYGKRIR